MLPEFNKVKGVHPGAVLRRELIKQNIRGSVLARLINEHKQTISALLCKRREINPKLSIKLSKQFNVDEDYFMLLQAAHDVKKLSEFEFKSIPNLKKIRKTLFWDVEITEIDWSKSKRSVIQRVLERGNKLEIIEFIDFYGKETICEEMKYMKKSQSPSFEKNIKEFNLI